MFRHRVKNGINAQHSRPADCFQFRRVWHRPERLDMVVASSPAKGRDRLTTALGATGTPADDGFYFPADTARQAQTWLPWPRETTLQKVVADLAARILRYQPVSLVVNPGEEAAARAACGPVSIVPLRLGSPRLRDVGPCFLVDGKGGSAAADWGFGGWGGRRPAGSDATFAHEMLGHIEVRRFRTPLTLESSAFVADGGDTVIALAASVFDPARNPNLTRLEAFSAFQKWLGVSRVIWVEDALPGDELCTDLRALVAFLAPGVAAVSTAPADHPHARALGAVRGALARAKDASGRLLGLVDLCVPPAGDGDISHVRSYTNYLAVNGALFVPVFDAPTDENALDLLGRAFQGRVIEAVPANELAARGVSLTSLCLPQPARLLERDRATTLPRSAWTQPVRDVEALLQAYIDMAEKK